MNQLFVFHRVPIIDLNLIIYYTDGSSNSGFSVQSSNQF